MRVATIFVCTLLAACGGEPRCEEEGSPELAPAVTAFPGASWDTGDVAASGLDPVALADAAAYSESIAGQCLLVVHDGKIVFERYYNGASPESTQKAWSMTKSFAATLVGMAQRQGRGTCGDRKLGAWLDGWAEGPRAGIELRHVMSHTTGLAFDQIDDVTWAIISGDFSGDAQAQAVVTDTPGTVFHYSQKGVQLLEPVLRAALGEDPGAFARRELFDAIGMSGSVEWERDAAGHVPTYAGLHVSCRDAARLGLLYLNGGTWDGEPILRPGFVRAATTPSQQVNPAVGQLWWLNGQTPAIAPGGASFPGVILPHAPADTFAALGLGQNFIDVIPSARTVIVHMRPAPQDRPGMSNDDLFTAFVRDGVQGDHDQILQRMKLVP